jgi:hypothetical protein
MSENPVSWLEHPMKGYRGEVGQSEARLLARGSWYFDRQRRELVYLPLRDSQFAADREGVKRVRWQLRLVQAQAGARKDDAAALGIQLALMEPYQWR